MYVPPRIPVPLVLTEGHFANVAFQIEEVKGVEQALDEEEIISMHEFSKFEEKLRQQKGAAATASASLDSAP